MMENKNRGYRSVILQATLLLLPVTSAFFAGSCRMAPKDNPGDTVASAEFYPPDTTQINRHRQADSAVVALRPDSTDVFYVGEGSTRRELQLVSYPSRRDTVVKYYVCALITLRLRRFFCPPSGFTFSMASSIISCLWCM